ncbi:MULTISPECIES: low molecular weight protein-tyrosine-phosphatase [unclassified Caulobacter]|uniref:low molecular weight protein-tyrosine-phosphatase n=1 Tax=unclassified Caulobacter TaxID=2648921 RepID=UPI000D390E22|nr:MULTISPECIES: low molecular weight protein-tyrosine-phosphatase [unclassified Caulobacter]PTS86259.1 phosphotyrosine protein phosphatase [Caulobacter sp. HMWF009]PTT09839.1 phosphotyrosine protein phosphatase [Caulobacter sp. HMWF025]
MRPSVLFVCLGNICRSPLAEGAFRHEARAIGLEVVADSAGTGGWHAGEPPDPRAIAAARRQGVDISGQRARQVKAEDFRRFDLVLALDHDNLRNLRALMPKGAAARLDLLLDYAPGLERQAVADPYYGDDAGFDLTWQQVSLAARDLARRLRHGEI